MSFLKQLSKEWKLETKNYNLQLITSYICIALSFILSFIVPPRYKGIDYLIYNQENVGSENIGSINKVIVVVSHRVGIGTWVHTVRCLCTWQRQAAVTNPII